MKTGREFFSGGELDRRPLSAPTLSFFLLPHSLYINIHLTKNLFLNINHFLNY